MSPNIWNGCVKIHFDCGGICRWVEAVERPAVGYHGECLHCGDSPLQTEEMIPIAGVEHGSMLEVPREELENLEWNLHESWDENQDRLQSWVESLGVDVRRRRRVDAAQSRLGGEAP